MWPLLRNTTFHESIPVRVSRRWLTAALLHKVAYSRWLTAVWLQMLAYSRVAPDGGL